LEYSNINFEKYKKATMLKKLVPTAVSLLALAAADDCPNRHWQDDDNTCHFAYQLTCTADKVQIAIAETYFENQGMTESNIGFSNATCTPSISSTQINDTSGHLHDVFLVEFELDDTCGMASAANETGRTWIYSNSIELTGDEVNFIDSRPIPFACHYDTQYDLTATTDPVLKEVILAIDEVGLFSLGLNTYGDDGFENDLTEAVQEDEFIYIEIDSTSMVDLDRMLYLEDCTLSNYDPAPGAHTPKSWDDETEIIVNGCEEHQDTEIIENISGQTTQFKSKIFTITSYEQAWFACSVRFCDIGGCLDYQDTCTAPSQRAFLSGYFHGQSVISSGASHARKRRSVSVDDSGSVDDDFNFSFGPFKNANYQAPAGGADSAGGSSDGSSASSSSDSLVLAGATMCMAAILN
jgi:hypothetical protein